MVAVAGCSSDDGTADTTVALAPTTLPAADLAAPPSTALRATTSTTPSTTQAATTTTPSSTTTTTTQPAFTRVASPADYSDMNLAIHMAFRSEVSDLTSEELASIAIAILNDPDGWPRSGFTFVVDETSELTLMLAEAGRVDELCLPLQTHGTVSCQNGAIVALNADRWRTATDDWDSTVDDYRTYLINHEVGHLIGLRHPATRCPADRTVSAVMEPQTKGLEGCAGNGRPLEWEIQWAMNRPAKIGPTPDWEGPRPSWP